MVIKRHCCYGLCNNDSRYPNRPGMEGVFFVHFPKPKTQLAKCERWIRKCGRPTYQFNVSRVTRSTFICSKHFVGGKGPTDEHPDPIQATLSTEKSSDHFVFSGSGDRTVMMHNLHTGTLDWTFKEHGGIITSVQVHGNDLYSACYDRLVRCFDIKAHCLRKMYYGAGKGVVMRLEVHGDKLYTGNREGEVECILMKPESWTCRMSGCQYVFGLREHLLYHLLADHLNTANKVTRCLWKDCSDWLSMQKDSGSVESHMRSHVDSLTGLQA